MQPVSPRATTHSHIRYAMERRFRVMVRRIHAARYRLSGAKIGARCLFEAPVDFVYGWRVRFGTDCTVDAYAQFKCPTSVDPKVAFNIDIGNNVFIGRGSIIDCNMSVRIGSGTFVAPDCFITDTNHKFQSAAEPIRLQGSEYQPVEIEQDVWLGARVVVLPGVRIGRGAVVGACSVVSRDLPAGAVAMGVPARVKKMRSGF